MQEESAEKTEQLQNFQSDDLLEKLKMLNYEKHLLREYKLKPLSRFYFVKATNPGEQFFMFTLICWWLCGKLGKDMERPQEYDDPNTVIAKIMQMLEEIVSKKGEKEGICHLISFSLCRMSLWTLHPIS